MSNADEEALRAIRAASPALQEWWPDGEMSPRSWQGVMWSDDRVQGLDLKGSGLEVLAPQIGQLQALNHLWLNGCPLKELPPQVGLLLALTYLGLSGCEQLTLAPGAEKVWWDSRRKPPSRPTHASSSSSRARRPQAS
jgi:hypothetical protein